MTLPKFSPKTPLSSHDSYARNILCYGEPPKGYRWLNVGDATTEKTLLVCSSHITKYPYGSKVRRDQWPAIEPVAKLKPKANPTIGDRRRDALVLEEVSRTKTDVHFKIVKQRYAEVMFEAKNGIGLYTGNFPAVYTESFYLRGEMKSCDNDILTCPIDRFARITEAVLEYNASFVPKPRSADAPSPTPLEQIKTLLSATPEIAADVMRECIRVIADRS